MVLWLKLLSQNVCVCVCAKELGGNLISAKVPMIDWINVPFSRQNNYVILSAGRVSDTGRNILCS